jgi:hypothetical protein
MASKRVRAELMLDSAKSDRKRLLEKLAEKATRNAGNSDCGWLNTPDHWQDVGRYKLLNELLWECDK